MRLRTFIMYTIGKLVSLKISLKLSVFMLSESNITNGDFYD